MPMNRVQFQSGMPLPEFQRQFGTERQCAAALENARWPTGFRCPHCQHARCYVIRRGQHNTFQCTACRHQTSLLANTLFQDTHVDLTVWFLAIYLVSEAKTGLSALALKRQLGVSYPTAWLMHHKLMQAMVERDALYKLTGIVQVDDAYLGGERTGGKAGRGSENKVPFIAAVALNKENHPMYLKLTPVSGFTLKAIAAWAQQHLSPSCTVMSDGLGCFPAVKEVGCQHCATVAGGRKPKELPEFRWINTILGNVKTSLSGAYHAFDFGKYATRYLAAIAYRFNRRFELDMLPERLLVAAASCAPHPEKWLRMPTAPE